MVASLEGAPGAPGGSPVNQVRHADEDQQISPISTDRLDADHDNAPLRLRSMKSIVGQVVVPGFAIRNIEQGELKVHLGPRVSFGGLMTNN
jgi:hypothetical protein